MTTPAPMTAQAIVEALCEAQDAATAKGEDNSAQAARRDRIKAALVAVLEDYEDLHFKRPVLLVRLEEACRGH